MVLPTLHDEENMGSELASLQKPGFHVPDGNGIHPIEPHVFGFKTETHEDIEAQHEAIRARRAKKIEERTLTEAQKSWALGLIFISGWDLIISSSVMVLSFRFAVDADGVSLYCVGLQSMSHLMSSILLILRFSCDLLREREETEDAVAAQAVSDECLLKERRKRELKRERDISVFMGLVMIISSAAMFTKAIRKAYYWNIWYLDHKDLDEEIEFAQKFLSMYGFAIYSLTAFIRFLSAIKLKKVIVWHAFGASVVSVLFLLVIGVAEITEAEWSWKAEPFAAIILAMGTVMEASRVIHTHRYDISALLSSDSWWRA